jgi:dipeptidyl aminopeptidase/acylaminoacyl peptidase
LTRNTAWDRGPDWSPDGSKIAFISDRDGDYEIYVIDADGTNVTQLTRNTAWDRGPDWSPDGSKIAFHSDRDSDFEIYVMDADGTNVTQLTRNTAWDRGPDWSPDGSKIAFYSDRDNDYEIYVMDADGSNVVKLTKTLSPIINQKPAWSPDGKKIAFMSDRDGDNEIYVVDAGGTNVRQLTNNTADEWGPDWCWASTVEQVEFELESIKVLAEMVFDVSPFDVPTEGYILLAIDASVITPVDTHNAEVEIQLWDKNNVTEYDRDVSYLGETIANKEKSFRVVLYHDQPIAWEDSSLKLIFRSDELTYIKNN